MSADARRGLWLELQARALVSGELPPRSSGASAWYIRVMLGVAGWIGALFVFGFLGVFVASSLQVPTLALSLGVLCCAAAWGLFRRWPDHDFISQFGLAASLAGQAMFAIGLFESNGYRETGAWLALSLFELALAALVANPLHRLLTAWGALAAAVLALGLHGLHGLAPGLIALGCAAIWLEPRCWALHGRLWRPVGYALVLGWLQVELLLAFGPGWFWRPDSWRTGWLYMQAGWAGTTLVGAAAIWVVLRLLRRQQLAWSGRHGVTALVAVLAIAALSFAVPGMVTALLILILGFAGGNRILVGLGLLALGGFLSNYYYQLHSTLLVKSGVLAASGVLLLLLRLAFLRLFRETEAPHA